MADRGRHPVAQGGMWNTPKVQYSQATQNMLKEMMQESKLTNFQQRQLNGAMRGGSSLPVDVNPTTSQKKTVPSASRITKGTKVLNPRNYSSNIRTRSDIEASGAYERDKYVSQVETRFYEKDKQRLANIMAFGEDIDPTAKKRVVKPPPQEPKMDRFDELQKEIEDRRSFIEDMEAAGQGGKYRSIIDTEISQLIREMEVIDKKRTSQLERLIAAEDKAKQNSNSIPNADV